MTVPSFAQSVSICISRVLDDLGVNEATVAKRRELYHQAEVIKEIGHNLLAKHCDSISLKNYKICHFGSNIEGSTTLGMHSDIDLVYISPFSYEIVQSNLKKSQSLFSLTIDKSASNGHCKLALEGLSLLRFYDAGKIKDLEPFYYDHQNNRFIPHTHFSSYFPITTDMKGHSPMLKDGPSLNCRNTDHVRGVLVPASMSLTRDTVNRLSTYQWPTNQVIDKIKEENGLVVPIGNPQSENANIEWRMSYSFAERSLIFDFNITQLRSLTILKMIKKTFFQPVVGNTFTSYHCKTTLFHSIARTAPCIWREDRVFDCVLNSLNTLQYFLSSRYCPHFFDLSVNLFVGKLTTMLCKRLSIIVNEWMNKNLRCLLQIQIDNLGPRILNFRTSLGSNCFVSRELIDKKMIAEIVLERNQFLIEYSRLPYTIMFKSNSLKKQIEIGFRLISELLYIIDNGNGFQEVVKLMLPYYLVEHSSLLAAYRIKKRQQISKNIIDLFRIGFHTDATSGRLKLASVLCSNMEYEESLKVLNEVQDVYASSNIHLPMCFMYVTKYSIAWKESCKLPEDTLDSVCYRDVFSSCVGFKRKDIWCCPMGLRRSVINIATSGLPYHQDSWAFHNNFGIEVDSKVMFHYLKYPTHSGLSKQGQKRDALKELMQTVVGNPKIWTTSLFEISDSKDREIVNMYRKCVLKSHDNDEISDVRNNKLFNSLRIDPWGSIRKCLEIVLSRNSFIQHNELALILIGYCFELEGKLDFACAFYWMSFVIDPNVSAGQHLLRVQPNEAFSKYFKYFFKTEEIELNIEDSIKLELDLTPEVVGAFVNIMRANIYLGLSEEEDFHEAIYRTRCNICLLNALVRLFDRQSSPALELFPKNRRILQANRSSLLL